MNLTGVPKQKWSSVSFLCLFPHSFLAKVQFPYISLFPLQGLFNQSILNIGPIAYIFSFPPSSKSGALMLIHSWAVIPDNFSDLLHQWLVSALKCKFKLIGIQSFQKWYFIYSVEVIKHNLNQMLHLDQFKRFVLLINITQSKSKMQIQIVCR